MSYVAKATLQILKHPDLFRNQRVFLSPFQASQREIVAELEKAQNVKYKTWDADSNEIVTSAQSTWKTERDLMAAYTLVSAGVLLPGHGADFLTSRKAPLLEEMVEMPKMSLETVIKTWVERHPAAVDESNIQTGSLNTLSLS